MIVERFFVWVATATVDQRCEAVGPLVRAFVAEGVVETDREWIEAALTLLADDEAIEVRLRLAEAVSEIDRPPRHVLNSLLWDEPAVGAIVAGRSEALIDVELIEAVAAGDEVCAALARRRRVGPGLSAALAETVDRASAVALLANPGAEIGAATLERLVERFGEFADLRNALAARPHVPITVRHRVLEKLAEVMTDLVVVGRFAAPERAKAMTRDARERATVALAAEAGPAETTVLVEHLRHTGQLTTRLLLRAVCIGDLRFVEEALGRLAGVPVRRVAAFVAEGRENAFRALYARAGMPERAFDVFAAALEVNRTLLRETSGWDGRPGDRARFSRRLIERVLTRWGDGDRRTADDLLALLRRFAADAAREQARALLAESAARIAAVPQVTGPQVVAPELAVSAAVVAPVAAATERIAAGAPVEAMDVEEVEVVEAEPDVAIDPDFAAAFAAEIAGAAVEAVVEARVPDPVRAATLAEPVSTGDADLFDAPVGLFSHVDLADVPSEWLSEMDEAGPASAFFAAGFADDFRGALAA